MITLHMLIQLRRNPKISAHLALEGVFDYNKTPLAPTGTKVVVHENPDKHASWSAHGVDVLYLGPAMDHYRCCLVYVTNTRAKRKSDTVEFFPQHAKLPGIATINADTTASQKLVTSLPNPKPNTAVEKFSHRQLAALRILAQIVQHTSATNKLGFESPKHTAKPRMEASNPKVQKQLPPSALQR